MKKYENTILTKKAQVILEFTFCMVVILLMLYGVAKVFFWTGKDVAERRIAHDTVMMNQEVTPLQQIDPYYYTPTPMNSVWDGN